jgi:hypothetical protein
VRYVSSGVGCLLGLDWIGDFGCDLEMEFGIVFKVSLWYSEVIILFEP